MTLHSAASTNIWHTTMQTRQVGTVYTHCIYLEASSWSLETFTNMAQAYMKRIIFFVYAKAIFLWKECLRHVPHPCCICVCFLSIPLCLLENIVEIKLD